MVTRNKQKCNNDKTLKFETPARFLIEEVLNCIVNLSRETRDSKNPELMKIKNNARQFSSDEEKFDAYFEKPLDFDETKPQSINKGTYNDGSLEKFISRIRSKIYDEKLAFLFGSSAVRASFEEVLRQFLRYTQAKKANVTIIDLSIVPFEVLSITVSLISRLAFEYGYFFKKVSQMDDRKTPLLLVYEEAHKYVPRIQSARYNSSRVAIERIAKEGRKYGVTLVIVSQRPSEISETIFSQCNNFICMRLTNPEDQNYIKRLLPDSLAPLTESLPTLESGEAILVGDSVIMPSLVKLDRCSPEPSSSDVQYYQEWKRKWLDVDFDVITKKCLRVPCSRPTLCWTESS